MVEQLRENFERKNTSKMVVHLHLGKQKVLGGTTQKALLTTAGTTTDSHPGRVQDANSS